MPEKSRKNKATRIRKRAVAYKLTPNNYTFASLTLSFRQRKENTLEEGEFRLLLARAIYTVHGDFANETDVLKFTSIDSKNYTAIIRFKTIHYTRVITGLLLFDNWTGNDCRFDIVKSAQTPCFLSL